MVTRSALKRSTLAIALLLQTANAWATITFIGEGNIPGTATDQSGLTKVLEDGVTPGNQVPLVVTSAGQSSPPVTMAVR